MAIRAQANRDDARHKDNYAHDLGKYATLAEAAQSQAEAMAELLEEAREKLRLLWIRAAMEDSDHEWLMATDDTLAAWKDKP